MKYNKEILISESLKTKIETTVGKKNAEITYCTGGIVEVPKFNLDYINPAKIFIKKNDKHLVILNYG
ncbi:MAG: hypothetical protein R3Y13_03885 [bacterium]